MVNYQNTWVPGNWTGVGPILPATVDNALGYYQQLKIMVAALNETRANCDNLADYTNEQLQNIVDYLNERIKDFDNAMNEFFKNTTAALDQYREDFEQFKTEMLAAYEQFTQELLARQDAFEQRIDAKIEEIEGEWNTTKAEWETVKAEWAALKAEWQQFKEDLLAQFEAFKEEVRNMFEDFQNQTNESLEQWKEETFQYFLGQYETIKQLLISQLPEIVQQYLPEALAGIAGVGLKYNSDTVKIDVNYGAGLAVDGEGRLFATGGGSGGSVVEAGQGIDVQSSGSTQTIAVKLASDSPNLEFDESGGLRATGGGSGGGGDTIAAGEGINITGEGTKTIQTAPATANTLGGVKTGDKTVTGLEVAEDGTISIHKWQPINITTDQMFFDKNLENIYPQFVIDCNNRPTADTQRFKGYVKFSQNTMDTLGLPDRVQIVNWVPEHPFTFDTTPEVNKHTDANSQISQQQMMFEIIQRDVNRPFRNGSGKVQFTWTGKENIIELGFSITNADMKFNSTTPIKIGGQGIQAGSTYTFNDLQSKQITFVLEDGTEIQQLSGFGRLGATNDLELTTGSDNATLITSDHVTYQLGSKNIATGEVTIDYIPQTLGVNASDERNSLISFIVAYSTDITQSITLVDSEGTNKVKQVRGAKTFTFSGLENYNGDNFTIKYDAEKIIQFKDNYSNGEIRFKPKNGISIYGLLSGQTNLILKDNTGKEIPLKNRTITTMYDGDQPHIQVFTNSTSINNPGLDVANPQIDNSENKFSKAQGNIEFSFKQFPLEQDLTYQSIADGVGWISIRTQAGETLLERTGRNLERTGQNGEFNAWNERITIDFSSATIGSQLIFKFEGASVRNMPTYEVVIGQVVD